jgi:hypothetical protein
MVFEVRRRHGLILDSAEIIDRIVHQLKRLFNDFGPIFSQNLMAAVYLLFLYDRSN